MSLIRGDARHIPLADETVQCVVTSPPYWGLRDYGLATWGGGDAGCEHEGDGRYYTEQTAAVGSADAFSEAGQANADRLKKGRWREAGTCMKCGAVYRNLGIGLERTLDEYIENMRAVGRELWRVLRDDGTFWLNLGDCYAGSWGNSGHRAELDGGESVQRAKTTAYFERGGYKDHRGVPPTVHGSGLKPKDLVGLPWRVAFALQADGWYLRSDIIWAKNNPMPESVTDRPTARGSSSAMRMPRGATTPPRRCCRKSRPWRSDCRPGY